MRPRSPSLLQPKTCGEREVPSSALAGHDDSGGVDAQLGVIGSHPLHARDAVVQTGRIWRHLWNRRGHQRVPEVDHGHGDALRGDDAPPGAVIAVVARHDLHAAAVDVVGARQQSWCVRTDESNVDRVAVGLGRHGVLGDVETLRRCDLFGVAHRHEGGEHRASRSSESSLFASSSNSSRLATSPRLGGMSNAPNSALMRGSILGSSTILLLATLPPSSCSPRP